MDSILSSELYDNNVKYWVLFFCGSPLIDSSAFTRVVLQPDSPACFPTSPSFLSCQLFNRGQPKIRHGAYSTLEGVDEASLSGADECSDGQHSAFFTVETFKVENVLLQLSSQRAVEAPSAELGEMKESRLKHKIIKQVNGNMGKHQINILVYLCPKCHG